MIDDKIKQHPDFIKHGDVVKTEVFSRIVGYIRPLASWAKHKQAEFDERQVYDVPTTETLA